VASSRPGSTPKTPGIAGVGATVPDRRPTVTTGLAGLVPDGMAVSSVALLVASAILGARAAVAPLLSEASNAAASAGSQVSVAALACFAVLLGLRTATGAHRHYGRRLLLGLVMVLVLGIAEAAEPVLPVGEWALLGVFVAAILLTVYQLTPLVASGVTRPMLVAAWLDMLIFFASGLAVTAVAGEWQRAEVSDATIAVVACLIGMIAWTATLATMLFARGVRIWAGGPFVLLAGLALVAVAGAAWIANVNSVLDLSGSTDFAFAAGALLIARGWLTWSLDAVERRSAWVVEVGRDMASTFAILVAIIVVLIRPDAAHGTSRLDAVAESALVFGVVVAGIRQAAVKAYERRARLAEAATSARLDSEILDRGRVARALEGLEPTADVAVTAERLCGRLLSLPCAEFVVITALDESGDGTPLAAAGVLASGLVGPPLGSPHADRLRDLARHGAWSEPAAPWLERWLPVGSLPQGPSVAHAPLVWDEHLVGLLTVGSRAFEPDDVARRLATAREAAVLVAALVGPALTAQTASRRRRERIDRVIATHGFHPVYQPIVELATERIVGFEALTRFDDGGRPDLWFEAASEAGRGIELEIATLTAAVKGSVELPAGCYLSLNLSAEVASSADVLGRVLTRIPRAVLLEITEHVPVEDYERMMANLYALDIQIRLAVDDAGAGYAGLQHILAIRPHVVKLDAALVRSVDSDVARQAIVGAMVSFAARTGCTIVGEGVETAAEVATLAALGVNLAQGYFYGRPRPASEWSHGVPAATIQTAPSPPAIPPR
jgi:EAL domain-containing protein (putative c-di-GMP-specific phosphodiesterase class I)